MVNFDTVGMTNAFIGGVIISVATSVHLLTNGRVTGMSGIFNGVITFTDFHWKSSFVAGLIMASSLGFLDAGYHPIGTGQPMFDKPQVFAKETSILSIILAGLFVGMGTKLGNGCTSGHGVCGIPRFSMRSLVAVPTFMATAFITANLKHNLVPIDGGLKTDYDSESAAQITFIFSIAVLILNCITNKKGDKGIADIFVSVICGAIFAAGLMISGMTRKTKIINFLTISEDWDISLMFVMVGAILVNLFTFNYIIHKKKTPVFGDKLSLPTKTEIDRKLIIGSSLFGIGWGIGGICPGPAMLIAPIYYPYVLFYFIPLLAVGSYIGGYLDKALTAPEKNKLL